MVKIDQRGSSITNQVIADTVGTINFGATKDKGDFAGELRKFLSEVDKLTPANKAEKKVFVDVKSNIEQAIIEAEEPEPSKDSILKHIESAKALLDGITSAAGLITTLIQASKIAGGFFG